MKKPISPPVHEVGFRDWFNEVQPLFQLQHTTQLKLRTPDQLTILKALFYEAYKAGWNRCGEEVLKEMKEKMK